MHSYFGEFCEVIHIGKSISRQVTGDCNREILRVNFKPIVTHQVVNSKLFIVFYFILFEMLGCHWIRWWFIIPLGWLQCMHKHTHTCDSLHEMKAVHMQLSSSWQTSSLVRFQFRRFQVETEQLMRKKKQHIIKIKCNFTSKTKTM